MTDQSELKHHIACRRDNGQSIDYGRLVLCGKLTRETATMLTQKLDAARARPLVADVKEIYYADAAALNTLTRWLKRAGLPAIKLHNTSPMLAAMIERARLNHMLHVTTI